MIKFFKRTFVVALIAAIFYWSFGFFIIPPIGVLKDGSTVMYFRLGLDSSFISSPETLLHDDTDETSPLERMVHLTKFGKRVNERKVASFPYSEIVDRIATME